MNVAKPKNRRIGGAGKRFNTNAKAEETESTELETDVEEEKPKKKRDCSSRRIGGVWDCKSRNCYSAAYWKNGKRFKKRFSYRRKDKAAVLAECTAFYNANK